MSIQNIIGKIKSFADDHTPNFRIIPDDLFLGLIIILVAFGSFGLGRLSKIESARTPIRIENAPEVTADTFSGKIPVDTQSATATMSTNTKTGELVGSKNGTKYYYSWCTGVSKISAANLIHFASKTEAESRGYTASATCKGL